MLVCNPCSHIGSSNICSRWFYNELNKPLLIKYVHSTF
uniref:Uncharacterized protein n=1 Tax=Arundo donax TaxID=35708 RepID=A0A0A9CFT3_ARUDO